VCGLGLAVLVEPVRRLVLFRGSRRIVATALSTVFLSVPLQHFNYCILRVLEFGKNSVLLLACTGNASTRQTYILIPTTFSFLDSALPVAGVEQLYNLSLMFVLRELV
jgi:hypothetical protein